MSNPVIVIITNNKHVEELQSLLKTINTTYNILIYCNDYDNSTFELGALKHVYDNTLYDEIFLLQDTNIIKDNDLFKIIFEDYKGVSIFFNPRGEMYLNKYLRSVLDELTIPVPNTKKLAVRLEQSFNKEYLSKDSNTKILFPELIDNDEREQMFGRLNMVIENDYLKKYKGCWDSSMVVK